MCFDVSFEMKVDVGEENKVPGMLLFSISDTVYLEFEKKGMHASLYMFHKSYASKFIYPYLLSC